jgi:L-alanine-DL-glutamate epimerase-like enolase superfamily enzyme
VDEHKRHRELCEPVAHRTPVAVPGASHRPHAHGQSAATGASASPTRSSTDATLLEAARALGLRQVKLKAGRDAGEDGALLRRAREVLGDAAEIRVDANGAWTPKEALARLPVLLDVGVAALEDPLPPSARDDYPAIVASSRGALRIVVDEGVYTLDDAHWSSATIELIALHTRARLPSSA